MTPSSDKALRLLKIARDTAVKARTSAMIALKATLVTAQRRARWTMRWKPVINAFAITSGDRWPSAEHY